MKELGRKAKVIHVIEALYAVGALAWFFLSLPKGEGGLALSPIAFPAVIAAESLLLRVLLTILLWFIPLCAVWKLASLALSSRYPFARAGEPLSLALSVLQSALVVAVPALHAIALASSDAYFAAQPFLGWLFAALSLAWNGAAIFLLIEALSGRSEHYQDYLAFRRDIPAGKTTLVGQSSRRGIQLRLTAIFTLFIFGVIVTLSVTLLRDFSGTIMASVIDKGMGLAERGASVMKSSLGDKIGIEDFFAIEQKKNATAAIPFQDLSFFRIEAKTGALRVEASTTPGRAGKPGPDPAPAVEEAGQLESAEGMAFAAPVILSKRNLGFVSVTYDREVILEPYFRTQVKVWIIAAAFIYAAFLLTYLIGRSIVFPILFLRLSVNSLSRKLSGMIKGSERVSAEALQYRDRVSTRDEIKALSDEVGNMAGVIRNVIPYISTSTLQHADKDGRVSERVEKAYLFTDIRGFTTLCEGRSPEEVVSLLNHYLALQSDAIYASGGEIDKYVGDEIMAVFSGPEKELDACRAGFAIRKAMAAEQEKARKESQARIEIGIGINSGPVVFGSVGARDRMDFTSIGDTVNLAARLEGSNKTYGTKSLVTEAVKVKVEDVMLLREIDLLTVKGKTKPVRIYEMLQEKASASPKLLKIAADFEKGLAAYRAKKWDLAEKLFKPLATDFADLPAETFLRRIAAFRADPPSAAWDGVFESKVK